MRKKGLVLLLIICMMIGMVGCGDTEEKTQSGESSKENNLSGVKEDEKEKVDITTVEGINADKFVTTKKNDKYKYDVYENHVEIVEYLKNEKKVEIPSEIDGLKVCRLVDFCNHESGEECVLEEVVIPEGVMSICDYNRLFCENVSNIVIPDTLSEIESYQTDTWGYSLLNTKWYKNLDEEYCVVGDGILIKCNIKDENISHLKYPEGVKKICADDWIAVGCRSNITEITFPEGCTEIQVRVAYGFGGIEKINFPDSLKSINTSYLSYTYEEWINSVAKEPNEDYIIVGDGVLIACNLPEHTKVYEIPEGVKYIACEIGEGAEKIILPKSIEGIGIIISNKEIWLGDNEYAFDFIETINIPYVLPDTNKKIADYAFLGWWFKEINIPDGVEEIGRGAFQGCFEAEKIVIPESCLYIRDSAFYFCGKMKNLVIPHNVTYIGDDAFTRCSSLENVTLSENLEYIGDRAFSSCIKLESITIPESVTYIGEDAFMVKEEEIKKEDGTYEYIYKNIPEIRGVKGSYAETYAKENGINFVEIEG